MALDKESKTLGKKQYKHGIFARQATLEGP